MTLTLLGTIHTDPKGPERLWKAVSQIQPTWVTVEVQPGFTSIISQTSIENIVRELALMQPPIPTERIVDLVTEVSKKGYDEVVPWGYAKKAGIPYREVDTRDFDPALSERYISLDVDYLKKVSEESKRFAPFGLALKSTGLTDYERHCVMNAQRVLDASEPFDTSYHRIPSEATEDLLIRDPHMESELRMMIQQHGPNGLHVGGHAHMFGNYGEVPNLYQRLADLKPVRRKLCEFD